MNAKSLITRTAGLLAGALLTVSGTYAAAAANAEADALPTFNENYVKVSGVGTSLSGSKASSQARTQIPKVGSAGIEEYNLTKELSKVTTLQIDGRAMVGAEDYLAQFKLTKNEVGSFEAGYKRFRTFYDGMGGFFPINNAWLPLYNRALFVDRGRFFVNGTIALPKAPVFTFKYTNETRSGRKDSTIWGDTDMTGVPIYSNSALNPISANRKIVPSYIQLGERQENWEVAVKQTVGQTTYRLAVGGDRINNLDTRSVDRYPGELKPFPAIPSNPVTLVPAALANNQNKGFDSQTFKETGILVSGKVETVINDKMTAYISGSYRDASADTAGSRLITARLQTLTAGIKEEVGAFTPAGRPPYSHNSVGSSDYDVSTGVVGLQMNPTKDLGVDVALKAEHYKVDSKNSASYVSTMINQTTGVVTPVPLVAPSSSSISEKPLVPEVDFRYTGIKKVSLFGSWDYVSTPSDERLSYVSITTSTAGPVVLAPAVVVTDDVKEKHSNFKIGGNWTPNSLITLRGEFFSKDHENNFRGYGTSLGGYYILDYDILGARLSATLKPIPQLSFTTRYVQQRGKASVMEDGYLTGDSNDSKRYQIAETVDWNPTKLFYMQGSVNVVWDKTSTAYPRAGGSANDVLHNADNNYWNGSVVAGFVIDKETDALLQATYYKADNYAPALATATDPYGQGCRDYSLAVGVKHKFSDRMSGSAKIGYFNSNSETTGGFANYKGTVGYLTLDYRL